MPLIDFTERQMKFTTLSVEDVGRVRALSEKIAPRFRANLTSHLLRVEADVYELAIRGKLMSCRQAGIMMELVAFYETQPTQMAIVSSMGQT